MKKMFFSLLATVMVSSFGFANTIEIKEVLPNEKIENLNSNSEKEVEDIRTCYEVSRKYDNSVPGISTVTITYVCFQHPGVLGNSTVYIDAPQP